MKKHTDSVNSDDSSLLPSDMKPAAGQAAHTPTPWMENGNRILTETEAHGAYGEIIIARCEHPVFPAHNEANAAFIVRACNAHAGLVEALEASLLSTKNHDPEAYHQARAALQSAKE